MIRLPARQVHLDFHTSEHMVGVGSRFRRAQFQKALRLGHVNSVTLFAKCHHSWSYYPTKVGRRHPALTFDLLGEQIRACHDIGVRAPIYYTVGWSANDAAEHPEWRAMDRPGQAHTFRYDLQAKPTDPLPLNAWIELCPSSGYRALMLAQTREICSMYPVDGFFYDICHVFACRCPTCLAGMQGEGVDAEDESAARAYSVGKWASFMRECRAIIHAAHPAATVFFNGLAHMSTPAALTDQQTHFELEDLPTTWGGYDKFPLRSRSFARFGKSMLAMSGKFHTSWGEFGGFKHRDALRFEASAMIAYGARCSIGDQLHPGGEMDLETYRNIGFAYAYAKRIEPYGLDGEPFSSLGLLPSGHRAQSDYNAGALPHDQGVANMLLESQIDFEVVPDDLADLSRFQTLVLTGARMLDAAKAAALTAYVRGGGRLLVLGDSALPPDGETPLLDVGADRLGPAETDVDYLRAGKSLGRDLVATPFLNYIPAGRYRARRGARALAWIREPAFNRTYEHYCSHQYTPYRLEDAPQAGAIQRGRTLLLPHPLGANYYHHGARVHRQFFVNALRLLHPRPTVEAALPSAGRVSVVHQPARRRFCVHLLYAPPLQRGRCLVVEDLPALHDVRVALRVPQAIRRARLPLAKRTLRASRAADAVVVRVPEVRGHAVVAFEY